MARDWETDWAHMGTGLMEGWLESKHLARHWETDWANMEACLKEEMAAEQTLGKGLGD